MISLYQRHKKLLVAASQNYIFSCLLLIASLIFSKYAGNWLYLILAYLICGIHLQTRALQAIRKSTDHDPTCRDELKFHHGRLALWPVCYPMQLLQIWLISRTLSEQPPINVHGSS